MISRKTIEAQLPHTLASFDFPALGPVYHGKVRDSYTRQDRRILITSDRLSAFDRVLTTIPFKGQVLNATANYWFQSTGDIIANHVLEVPHPNIFVAQELTIVPIEVVVRGYLTGSAWRDYTAGKAISGVTLTAGMKEFARFDTPIITPSTKAPSGTHDEPISEDAIVRGGIVPTTTWEEIRRAALALFTRGTELTARRGLILVDTKYEFGLTKDGKVVLADEIHTPDSSRYWTAESYRKTLSAGTPPLMLDKEFVRRWLLEQGYSGEGTAPIFPDSFRVDIAERYISSFEQVTGTQFSANPSSLDELSRVIKTLV